MVSDVAILTLIFHMGISFRDMSRYMTLGESAEINLPVFMLMGVVALAANRLFMKKERSASSIVILNIIIAAVSEMVLMATIRGAEGFFPMAVAFIFFLYPAARAATLVLKPTYQNTMILYVDGAVVFTAFYFIAQFGAYAPLPFGNALCVGVIVLDLSALIYTRIKAARAYDGGASAKIRGFAIAVSAVIILSAAAVGVTLMLSPAFADAMRSVFNAFIEWARELWRGILFAIGKVMDLLAADTGDVSWIPREDAGAHSEVQMMEQMMEISDGARRAMAAAALAVFAAAAAFAAVKLRKVKVASETGDAESVSEKTKGSLLKHISQKVKSAVRKVFRRARFISELIAKRNDPEGFYGRLCIWGKRRGVPKLIQESPTEYINRVREKKFAQGIGDGGLFSKLADYMENAVYAENIPDGARMSEGEVAKLRKILKNTK